MTPAGKILIGIDIGTSATKVVAYGVDGRRKAAASRDYPLSMPHPGWSEQNPEHWWRATAGCLRDITRQIDASRVAAISFSGQMHGPVFLDAGDKVIRPCMLWNDSRATAQCAKIIDAVGRDSYLAVIKNLPLVSYTLPKLLWMRDHEPAHFDRLRTLLLPKDYVRFRLTGVKSIDETDAAGTAMLEIGRKRWAVDILSRLGIDPAILPSITHSSDVAGRIIPQAAKLTGLRAGTPVVAGAADQPAGAIGVGVIAEGQAMVGLGTSGVILAPTNASHVADHGGLASFDHAIPGSWYLMGCVLSAGAALRWYRETFCQEEAREARRRNTDVYDLILEAAQTISPGAEGLVFLPYLMGERTPHDDPRARGVFFGISSRHTKAHFTRALIEGISFALRDALDLIQSKGILIRSIRATGGGARSPMWLQMLGDIFNLPVISVENPDGPALGAAILAGVGASEFASFSQAIRKTVTPGRTFRPRRKAAQEYDSLWRKYRQLYPALRESFQSISIQ